jgi:Fic family protein
MAGLGVRRKDRMHGAYEAYVPDAVTGSRIMLDAETAADVSDAELNIARLDASSSALANMEVHARLLLRAESVASSRIEGLRISPQRLLRADADRAEGIAVTDTTAREVLANVDAMACALENPADDVSPARIDEVHRRLLEQSDLAVHAGHLRTVQNWIGGSAFSPLGARFIPPPPELVPELIDQLCEFINTDSVSPIVQAAVAHAQFETIHPYVDGNGRTGRALIYMVLRRRGLALRSLPPISLILATRAEAYVDGLIATRSPKPPASHVTNGLTEWIGFFASAATRAVADAQAFEQKIAEIQTRWRAKLGTIRSDSAALTLIEQLPSTPITSVRAAEKLIGRSRQTADAAVMTLVNAGILQQSSSGRRNRKFEATELIAAFVELERQLASPGADTRVSPPARPVPDRRRRVKES